MGNAVDRRTFLQTGSLLGAAMAGFSAQAEQKQGYQGGTSPWPICLNHSTIRPVPFLEKIKIAQETGYDAVEPWIDELEEYEKGGGNLEELGKDIRERGLFIPNIIGLWGCMPATKEAWEESLVATRNRLRMAAAVGSQHIAAIPAPDRPDFDLKWGAERYRDLVRIGLDEFGITVAFEFVGFMQGIHRFGQACAIAIDANVPEACLIMDTFHLYRGGSGFNSIRHIDAGLIADFHWNDVPAEPAQDQLKDEHRIYPGDGILPLKSVLEQLKQIGYTGPLSIEMFNREQWEQDPRVVAETALKKTMAIITSV